MTHFFTSTIPGWWSSFISGGKNAMGQMASSLESGFKNAINWVITNVINRVIGIINNVTGIVGVPAIKGVGLRRPPAVACRRQRVCPRHRR